MSANDPIVADDAPATVAREPQTAASHPGSSHGTPVPSARREVFEPTPESIKQAAQKAGFSGVYRENIRYFGKERGRRPFYRITYRHEVSCIIGEEHTDVEDIITRLGELFDRCHQGLLKYLHMCGLPYDLYIPEEGEPVVPDTIPATAWPGRNALYIWGREHAKYDYINFSSVILHHELAHLVSKHNRVMAQRGAVPEEFRIEWLAAMQRDRMHHGSLPFLDIHHERQPLAGERLFSRKFGYGCALINHHAENTRDNDYGLKEDWPESVSMYLLEQERGDIWHNEDGSQVFKFTDYYPHRAVLIQRFLDTLEPFGQ